MSDSSSRNSWLLPVLLGISTSVALGIGFLYLMRPNASELGAIRVVVGEDVGHAGKDIHVLVAEAPLLQKEVVTPGLAPTGVVHYPTPYLTKPNLKLTTGKRLYNVITETEFGFTWLAQIHPEDLREGTAKEANLLDKLLSDWDLASSIRGSLKPNLVFEEFTWEAKGLRASLSAVVAKPFEQTGEFTTMTGLEGVVAFPIPYASAPNVQLSGKSHAVIITECTAQNFRWKNAGNNGFFDNGTVTWVSKGVLGNTQKNRAEPEVVNRDKK